MAQALLVSRFQKPRPEVTMDLKRRAENRARPRVSSFFSVFLDLYMNRTEAVAHLTISSQNHGDTETNPEIHTCVSHNGTGR